jgi:hypothetical protein
VPPTVAGSPPPFFAVLPAHCPAALLQSAVADPGFETRVFLLAVKKTSMLKSLDAGGQADGEHVLQ